MRTIEAGFARADITGDPRAAELYGLGYWYERAVRFTGVRDRLYARAAVLGEGARRAAVVSIDSIFDSYGWSDAAAARVSAELGVSPACVFINCTHAHSTPLIGLNNTERGREYGRLVEDAVVEATRRAALSARPCRVELRRAAAPGITRNRRPILADGLAAELHGALEPARVVDPGRADDTMTLAAFTDEAGGLAGALCHFAIHGVCIQCSDLISADAMGRAIQAIEHALPEGAVVLHLMGPAGDIDPVEMGDEAALEKTQRRLELALNGLLAAKGAPVELAAPSGRMGVFKARRRAARPPEELDRCEAALRAEAARDGDTSHHSGAGYRMFLLAEERKVGRMPETVEIPYRIIDLGAIVLVGVAGELFGGTVAQLSPNVPAKTAPSPGVAAKTVLWTGITGGWLGYFPPEQAYAQGGYEVAPARWSLLAPGQTEALLSAIALDIPRPA